MNKSSKRWKQIHLKTTWRKARWSYSQNGKGREASGGFKEWGDVFVVTGMGEEAGGRVHLLEFIYEVWGRAIEDAVI